MRTKSGLGVSQLGTVKTEIGWLGKLHDLVNKRVSIAVWNLDGTYTNRDKPELDLILLPEGHPLRGIKADIEKGGDF